MTDLFAELIEAFPPRPLDPGLLADPIGIWTTYIHDQEFEAEIPGHTWNTLSPAFVEYHCDALGWMTPGAFAAVLPAYLASLLRGDTENELPALVFLQLTRRPGWEEKFDTRVAELTGQQCMVTKDVLEALAKGDRFSHYRTKIDAALASWQAVLAGSPGSPG